MSIKKVQNPTQGLKTAKKLLYKHVDQKTALFLSGGSTPKQLYATLAQEKKLNPGVIALIDERYGPPLHLNSNERMIKETGLIDYLSSKKNPYYRILQDSHRHSGKRSASRISIAERDSGQDGYQTVTRQARMTLEKVAEDYDKKVKYLFSRFQKRVAILGIGEDGHIAGLPARTQNSKLKTQKYVIGIGDFPGEFKERITLTFNALSKLDQLIVLAFGEKKKHALELMFTQGSEEEIPARFFNLPDISKKTILITDQKV